MAAKAKASAKAVVTPAASKARATTSAPMTLTTEERLHRLEVLGKRIDGYVKFICQLATQAGSSAEVKERAVVAFYEQMVLVERQLGNIVEEMRLE